MPVDGGFGDTMPSSSLGNASFNFDISSPTKFDLGLKTKRICTEDKKSDAAACSKVGYFASDVERGNDDTVQVHKESRNQVGLSKTVGNQSLRDFFESSSSEDCSNFSTKGSVDNVKNLERKTSNAMEKSSVLSRKRCRDVDFGDAFELDAGALTSLDGTPEASLPPMKPLLEKLAKEIKENMINDWREMFSNLESFESVKLQKLDKILEAALAYEENLKKQKADLRQFLMKLSDSLVPE